jgi:SAM-dependent methyltransferase
VPDGRPEDSPHAYTHGHHDAVLRSHRWRTAENSAAYLLPRLGPGLSLLDVGCGPGTLTADLAARVAPGRVVGVDVSADVIAEAKGAAPGVELVVGDFRDPALALGSFDVVHAHQVLHHVHDPVGALRQMAELTKPGGLVAARETDYPAMMWAPADERLDRWLEVFLAVSFRNGAEAAAGRNLPAWARAAGLADATYTTSTWTFATPADRSWWGESWAERIASTRLAEQAVEYGVASWDELATIAQGWRDWAANPDGVFVVVHGEVLARV